MYTNHGNHADVVDILKEVMNIIHYVTEANNFKDISFHLKVGALTAK